MPNGEADAAKRKGSAPDGGGAGPARCPRGGRHRLRTRDARRASFRRPARAPRGRRSGGVAAAASATRAMDCARRGAPQGAFPGWGLRPGVADDVSGHGLERESNPQRWNHDPVLDQRAFQGNDMPESNRQPAACAAALPLRHVVMPKHRLPAPAYATAAPRAPDGIRTRAAGDRSIDASHRRPSPTGNPCAHAFPAAARIEHRDAAPARLVAEFRAATTRARTSLSGRSRWMLRNVGEERVSETVRAAKIRARVRWSPLRTRKRKRPRKRFRGRSRASEIGTTDLLDEDQCGWWMPSYCGCGPSFARPRTFASRRKREGAKQRWLRQADVIEMARNKGFSTRSCVDGRARYTRRSRIANIFLTRARAPDERSPCADGRRQHEGRAACAALP